MKLRTLASTLRQESLPTLMREAGLRGIHALRKSTFQFTGRGRAPGVTFHPMGYYQPFSDHPRAATLAYADAILRGEYPLMGYGSPRLGVNPDWHCDWVSGKRWPLESSGRIQLVRHDGSDVKTPWELSRLQFAPVVAKAYVLSGDRRYREAIQSILTDWIIRNPVGMGVNWTVAMEAALRAISLCLTMELLWPFGDGEKPWLDQMTAGLWQHLRFIEVHSEFSFRLRSNHYLSNIVGLTTLCAYLKGRGMERRLEKYAGAVQREILLQTYADGGDCEASTGYHVLVAQLGLHSLVVQRRCELAIAPAFEARLRLMFEWIAALADDAGKLPHLGDCDNGRVELLLDEIAQSTLPANQRHSLQTGALYGLASHLLQLPSGGAAGNAGKPVSLLPDSGVAVLRSRQASVVFCAMPNGLGGKGSHTHCDKLSVVFRIGPDEVFCDTGSRGYTRSAGLRNLDRSTKVHNTLVIDEADQNVLSTDPGSLFCCGNEATVTPIEIVEGCEGTVRASHQGYSRYGIEHRRTVQLGEQELLIVDEVSGREPHSLDLGFVLGPAWHAASEMMTGERVGCVVSGPRRLSLVCETEGRLELSVSPAEISREYGTSLPVSCIRIHTTARLPAKVRTRVTWDHRA